MEQARRGPRVATEISAVLIDAAGGEFPVVVIDLSSGGFRVLSDQQLLPGEHVRLRVGRNAEYPAQIEWATRREAGGRFLNRIQLMDGVPL